MLDSDPLELTIFVCRSCGKSQPCTLIVPGDVLLPKNCPWGDKRPNWIDVIAKIEADSDGPL